MGTRSASILCICLYLGLHSVSQANGSDKQITALRIQSAPVIDGQLNEAFWQHVEPAQDFTESKYNGPATEKTMVRVAYNDTHVFVGFTCLEPEMDKIVAVERKYDRSLRNDDNVSVRFDTFHDHRTAYVFTVNALGTREDMRQGLYKSDSSWGCDWEAATSRGEDRWYVEIAIPIKKLLFTPKDNAAWGVNFSRSERGIQEASWWSYIDNNGSNVRNFGNLGGLNLAKAKIDHNPSLELYTSNTTNIDTGDTKFATGADVGVRLNANLTSAFTIHPDFGQVEADPDTIELRDTERFLDERRPFFREGSELFQTPINVYYTRRWSKIDAGGKVTGNGKNWAMGLVDVYGEIERSGKELEGNYHAGRLIHYQGDTSHIGGIWTVSDHSDGTNATGGLDMVKYLSNTTKISSQVLMLDDSQGVQTSGYVDKTAYAATTEISGGTKPFWWNFNYKDISRGFKPDLGYVPRRNIRGPGTWLMYRWDFKNGPFKWFSANTNAQMYEDDNHDTTLRDYYGRVSIMGHNQVSASLSYTDNFHRPYNNWTESLRIEYNEEVDYWNSVSVGVSRGVYNKEPYKEYSLSKPQRITDRLVTEFRGNLRLVDPADPTDDDQIWLMRSITTYNFTWGARLKFTAEKTSSGRHNITSLFSWPYRKNIDLYVLFNDYETRAENISEIFFKAVYKIN